MKKFTKQTIVPVICSATLFSLLSVSTAVMARTNANAQNAQKVDIAAPQTVAAKGVMEVAFSPNEGGEALIVKVIESAKHELLVLGYSFTSAPVTQALIVAKKRGVIVRVVVDQKNNITEDHSGKARAALSALATAGVDVRTISAYPIHHDKSIIADRLNVETGSFNYSEAAARRNSENVLVNWNNRDLALIFLTHFERNYQAAHPFIPSY